jgi:hypothetical protein
MRLNKVVAVLRVATVLRRRVSGTPPTERGGYNFFEYALRASGARDGNRRAQRQRPPQAERSVQFAASTGRLGRSEYSEHLRLADLFPIAVRIVPKLSPVVLSAHLDFQSFIHKNDGATVPLQGLIANHAGLQRIPTRSTGDEKNET